MYCEHFGFSEKPFDVTPDPRFLYLSAEHEEALAALLYGIQERRGFIVLVGEVGTGKTTLLNTVLDRLDDRTKTAYVFNTDVAFETLLNNILAELSIASPGTGLGRQEAIERLNRFAIDQLRDGGNMVLIVDEAQNLSLRAMENLRLLSNLETRKHKLIQIVLSGQPELDAKLNDPGLRQLAQRISLKRYITPLSEADTGRYMKHRLALVGCRASALFDRTAGKRIWEFSGGIPRKINILCDNALLIAYGLGNNKIKADIIEEAVRDLSSRPFSMPPAASSASIPYVRVEANQAGHPKRAIALAAMLLIGIGFAIGVYLGKGGQLATALETVLANRPAIIRGPILTLRSVEEKTEKAPAKESIPPDAEIEGTETQGTEQTAPQYENQEKIQKIQRETGKGTLAQAPQTAIPAAKKTPAADTLKADSGPAPGLPKEISAADASESEAVHPESMLKPRPAQTVAVRPGDSLSKIITRTYGGYDESMLQAVLRENPNIETPNQIYVGQLIKLPELLQ